MRKNRRPRPEGVENYGEWKRTSVPHQNSPKKLIEGILWRNTGARPEGVEAYSEREHTSVPHQNSPPKLIVGILWRNTGARPDGVEAYSERERSCVYTKIHRLRGLLAEVGLNTSVNVEYLSVDKIGGG